MFLPPRTLRFCRTVAALAMLVLLLGLPRWLVSCSGGDVHGPSHIEFAHAPGECCAHGHAHRADVSPPHDHGTLITNATANPNCEHTEFAIELAPVERTPATAPPLVLGIAGREHASLGTLAAPAVTRLPKATGPPRPHPQLLLRTTTLLLL